MGNAQPLFNCVIRCQSPHAAAAGDDAEVISLREGLGGEYSCQGNEFVQSFCPDSAGLGKHPLIQHIFSGQAAGMRSGGGFSLGGFPAF